MTTNSVIEKETTPMEEIPICRLCLQERDFYGNLPTIYDDGLVQHRTCMAKYSKNRRALKRVIFKMRYQEYFGDVRPAGVVDREAMAIIYGKSKKEKIKETLQEIKAREKNRRKICAHARKCKEEKRKREDAELIKEAEAFETHMNAIEPPSKKIGSLIEESQQREEG